MTGNVKIVLGKDNEYMLSKKAVAKINPVNCVNCGTCREQCPVGAIEEQQREICRVCPECTSRSAMTIDEMKEFTTKQACTIACPLGISPQGYVNLTKAGKEEKAFQHIWDKNPLPSVCARICHHPCEQACKRGVLVDEPIAIRGIKRYLSDNVNYKAEKYPQIYDDTIAVIGAGPAGLTTAHYLLRQGYDVTVFEAESMPGGMLQRAIPEFRLSREAIKKDINRLQEAGMKIQFGERIGKVQAEKLMDEFDAVVVAAGASNSKMLKIDGYRKTGIFTALDFMEKVNNHLELRTHPANLFDFAHANVVVIGGGNVAIDCARTAKRLGAVTVTAICMECGEHVPCHEWELQEAAEEGVVLMDGWAPVAFPGEDNEVKSIEICKTSSYKSSDGKITFQTDPAEKRILDADYVILAIGQAPDAFWTEFENNDKVFFAGDVRSNKCSVVDAMAAGKETARQVDIMLQGRETKNTLELRTINPAPIHEKIYPAARLKVERPEMPVISAEDRVNNFHEVETEYEKNVIEREVLRCLQCGYQKVDVNKCIGCGVCASVCPKGDVITLVSYNDGGENNE